MAQPIVDTRVVQLFTAATFDVATRAEVTRVIHTSIFGYQVHTYSARTAWGPLLGEDAENAIILAYDVDVRGSTDQQFFEVFYAVCGTCGQVTDFHLDELKDAPIIHENGRGHHIGELVSTGQYE